MYGFQRHSIVVDNSRRSIHAWQDRIRDPSLTVLLILELCVIFLATPLAAKGLPIARAVADTLLLGGLIVVVMLSHRWGPNILNLLGLVAIAASILLSGERPPVSTTVLRRGDILASSAPTWVVAHAVYTPGRITFHRLQGAVVLYPRVATIFAAA